MERPGSVLKELVENSLDAKATKIIMEVKKGGQRQIRVADNGEGMDYDDVLLCIERYATSKIFSDADLFSISTLGFRGEALPSIASVSKMTIITRKQEAPAGTQVVIKGGKITSVSETGAPVGTMITVTDLFYNTPARRKFLKSIATEMGHIADTVSAMAMGWPQTGFELIHNDKTVFSWPSTASRSGRVADVLGKNVSKGLLKLSHTDPHLGLEGYLALPDFTRSTRRGLYLFVNNRLVRDQVAAHALLEGYHARLMKGQYPVAVLFITVPQNEVDVNVHPAKAQVRFINAGHVHDGIAMAVKKCLESLDVVPWGQTKPAVTPMAVSESEQSAFLAHSQTSFSMFQDRPPPLPMTAQAPLARTEAGPVSDREKSPGRLVVIGQFASSYILCQSVDGLLVVDQHAAHERVLFERFKAQITSGGVEVQNLLIPETFELSHSESEILAKILPDLAETGLVVEQFSGRTFVIRAVPAVLAKHRISQLVTQIVEKVAGASSEVFSDALEDCLILMACHGAIRANQELSSPEMSSLLVQLEECERPSQCPHGRPTWLLWTLFDLERGFKRK